MSREVQSGSSIPSSRRSRPAREPGWACRGPGDRQEPRRGDHGIEPARKRDEVRRLYPREEGGCQSGCPREAPARTGKGHVLFVDDEDMLVRTVPCMLERLGYTTEAVWDPAEALALFRENPGLSTS